MTSNRRISRSLKTWWRHQMKTFSALLAFCAENSPVPVNYPHKGQWRGALMFSLIWTWINSWVNNPEAGDLRRHRAHCDVSVMSGRFVFRVVYSLWNSTRVFVDAHVKLKSDLIILQHQSYCFESVLYLMIRNLMSYWNDSPVMYENHAPGDQRTIKLHLNGYLNYIQGMNTWLCRID